MLGVICAIWGCSIKGKAKGETDRWVFYGKTKFGDCYYNAQTITKVSPHIIKVSEKLIYSKSTKDLFIHYGWDKNIETRIELLELHCVDKTRKLINSAEYDNAGQVLDNLAFPNPKSQQILPGSLMDTLLKKICPQ